MNLKTYFREHQILADGSMGTYCGEMFPADRRSPELFNISHPERILAIHKEYLRAGARLLRTNSFASNPAVLSGGWPACGATREEVLLQLADNIAAAHRLARQAIREEQADGCRNAGMSANAETEIFLPAGMSADAETETFLPAGTSANAETEIFIAGDIGPIPTQGMEQEELLEAYFAIADAHLAAGAELLWFETFADFQYILPVAEYLKKKKEDIFIMASFCLNKYGYTRAGIRAQSVLDQADESRVLDGVGFNCGIGSTHMCQILKKLDFGDLVVSAMPNSGYPGLLRERANYRENVEFFCENMKELTALGVNVIGGCCGTTPAYIRQLKEQVSLGEPRRVHRMSSVSAGQAVQKEQNEFYQKLRGDQKPVVVELDPPFDGNDEKIVRAALLLKEAGADMLTFADSPMGKMRADSMMTGAKIQREIEIPVMPHVTCRDRNRLGMGAAFLGAHMNGIRNLLLVTGDPVPGGAGSGISPVYDFNSVTLMEYLQQMNREYFKEDPVVYGGALNYGRANLDKEIERMKRKIEAGASYFLTQPIYSREDVARIAYVKEHVETKILCGIMPLVSYRNACYMKNEMSGVHVPEEVLVRYHKDMSREEGENVGIAIALETLEQLAQIADGYYFMVPFNRASMICEIMRQMKKRGALETE